jgi:hypothetical protein
MMPTGKARLVHLSKSSHKLLVQIGHCIFLQENTVMTDLEESEKLYKEWRKLNAGWPYQTHDMIDFGAFCINTQSDKFLAIEKVSTNLWWAEVQRILLINFLKMPIESQKELFQAILDRRPDLTNETNRI